MASVLKAAVADAFGKPLAMEEVPAPHSGEELVKVVATAFATPTSMPLAATGR